jgi:hypothetical protein
MALAIVHMKSRKQIAVMHPWTAGEWRGWLQRRSRAETALMVCDEKGNQYVILVYEVEFVMVPLTEEK